MESIKHVQDRLGYPNPDLGHRRRVPVLDLAGPKFQAAAVANIR